MSERMIGLLYGWCRVPERIRSPPAHEHVVGDAVPGVVDAGEEQQQRRGADAEERAAQAGGSRERRHREVRVRRERQQEMEQPVLADLQSPTIRSSLSG